MEELLEGRLITKEKRQELFGSVSGGSGSSNPEKYQRHKIIELTSYNCDKTHMRINMRMNTLKNIKCPNTQSDGFDYSEDFDGVQYIENKTVYINLKCIVGNGGVQTRSLREVYWFIQAQLKTLLQDTPNIYFANILDGDEADKAMNKYKYLLELEEFADVKHRVYVGDLKGYIEFFKHNLANDV